MQAFADHAAFCAYCELMVLLPAQPITLIRKHDLTRKLQTLRLGKGDTFTHTFGDLVKYDHVFEWMYMMCFPEKTHHDYTDLRLTLQVCWNRGDSYIDTRVYTQGTLYEYEVDEEFVWTGQKSKERIVDYFNSMLQTGI